MMPLWPHYYAECARALFVMSCCPTAPELAWSLQEVRKLMLHKDLQVGGEGGGTGCCWPARACLHLRLQAWLVAACGGMLLVRIGGAVPGAD